MRTGLLISAYLVRAVLPYFIFAWLLLSVVLFIQQAGRFSDIFFSPNIPSVLVWQISAALVPNVIAFTCPMAVLVGVIIGLSRMQADNELIAARALGIGSFGLTVPILLLGIFLSLFAFLVNLKGVPLAASIVRRVALQTAIFKLESPIEPGIFNTEITGSTIFVREGDIQKGTWRHIFVHSRDERSGTVRLITSSEGRIDFDDQRSELVLSDAAVKTLRPAGTGEKQYEERVGELRYAVKTSRAELLQRLASAELTPEELGLSELAERARSAEGPGRVEAQILWQRRVLLSVSPLIFCLLGSSLVLRFARRGRGYPIAFGLAAIILYYLLGFLGEQIARTQRLPALVSGLLPLLFAVLLIAWLNRSGRPVRSVDLSGHWRWLRSKITSLGLRLPRPSYFADLTAGLRDLDVVLQLLRSYVLALGFLAAVFIIFTAFELWKFAGTFEGGIFHLGRYLFFLLPLIYIQLSPSAALIAILATYIIKSRQNELITWAAAGQSVYRLLFPALALMTFLGGFNWIVQETLMPAANRQQDDLRTLIRNRGKEPAIKPQWIADGDHIFSFLSKPASDNDNRLASLEAFQLDSDKWELQSAYRAPWAEIDGESVRLGEGSTRWLFGPGGIRTESADGIRLPAGHAVFVGSIEKPSHLTARQAAARARSSPSALERRLYAVSAEKRYTTIVLPLVIALFTAPFALSFARKGRVVGVGMAVGMWLVFMGLASTFEQFGLNGTLPVWAAVWGPPALFAVLGIFLLSRTRT
jgi:lipopolysaccharide export LptBFGC system permease protein LptF